MGVIVALVIGFAAGALMGAEYVWQRYVRKR